MTSKSDIKLYETLDVKVGSIVQFLDIHVGVVKKIHDLGHIWAGGPKRQALEIVLLMSGTSRHPVGKTAFINNTPEVPITKICKVINEEDVDKLVVSQYDFDQM